MSSDEAFEGFDEMPSDTLTSFMWMINDFCSVLLSSLQTVIDCHHLKDVMIDAPRSVSHFGVDGQLAALLMFHISINLIITSTCFGGVDVLQ